MSEKAIEAKRQVVQEVVDKMQRAQGMIFYDYRGLTVAEVTELRNNFRAAGVEYHVIKNSMLIRAAEQMEIKGLDQYLSGPTAVAFGYNDPVAPAKVLVDFVKKVKKTEIKSGVLGTKVVDVKGVEALSQMPSREQLIAQLAGTLNAPISGLARSLSGIICKLGYALNAVIDQKQA